MRKKKPDKRKMQGAETKKRLYDIAKRMFTEKNYDEVMIEDITDEAGITQGAFYTHFESKNALIAAIIADCITSADTDYMAFLATLPADLPSPEVLLALTGKIADVLTNDIGCKNMRKLYQLLMAGTVDTEAVKGYGRKLYPLLTDILERGILRGELKSSLTAQALARHYVAALRGVTYEWCLHHPDFDLKEKAVEHCRMILEGISA
jgi:AcrR family transcriptional regulator